VLLTLWCYYCFEE